MAKIPLYDKVADDILNGIQLAGTELETEAEQIDVADLSSQQKDDSSQCLTCAHSLETRDSQVEHYKSDWHRYNLKLKLNGAPPVEEEKFEEIMDEISSISGSESESEDDSESDSDEKLDKAIKMIPEIEIDNKKKTTPQSRRRTPKVFFKNANGQLLSIYKCILSSRNDNDDLSLSDVKLMLSKPERCCIILLSAGHFAAGVFEGSEALVHKTFHRYVLRAKQGTVQSVRDGQGSAPKSGGASLRRHNEAALSADIQTLLNLWKDEHLSTCSHIFLRAPHYNKSTFYNGKTAPLNRKDIRIKGIPFPTRRPTFNELKRVNKELFSIELHKQNVMLKPAEKNDEILNKFTEKSEGVADESKNIPQVKNDDFDIKRSPRSITKRKRKKLQNDNAIEQSREDLQDVTQEDLPGSQENNFTDDLYTVCKVGDLEGLKAIISSIERDLRKISGDKSAAEFISLQLNQPIGKDNETLLHIGAKAGHRTIVQHLLECGADPSVKYKSSAVPYCVSSDKAMRNVFRKFMSDNPNRYDYKSAQIPAPLTEEMEKERRLKQNEKKKAQKAMRKERTKEMRAEREKEEQEKQERERFAALSDREKRALAAERRLVQQITQKGSPLPSSTKRCWQCGESLLGKIPFEYLDYEFCTIGCLKKHKASGNVNR